MSGSVMDCNREEALRAKQLAEKKMEIKDFYGAQKIAAKAQKLYPELENISQMILVCEVHCSAEKKSYGDKDWYAILKTEPTADEALIKKQYRKLALVLHPDKNKFAGSTDAFKLIGEAQRVLLDREKRQIYDSKRKGLGNVSVQNWNPRPPSQQSNVYQHPWNQGRSSNFQFPQQPPAGVNRSTFWTVCPFCSVRYQFYRDDGLSRNFQCQSCKKMFTAFEVNAQGTTAAAPSTTQTQARQYPAGTYTTKLVFEKKEAQKPQKPKKPQKPQKSQGNMNKKRKNRIEESSESSDSSEGSSESEEEDENVGNNPEDFNMFGEQPRRSSRAKRDVSYKENLNENDNGNGNGNNDGIKKGNLNNEKSCEDEKDGVTEISDDDDDEKDGVTEISDDDNKEVTESKLFECPDTEFTDFTKDMIEENFQADQIWACYDTADAMPRFYAYITKVELTRFKLSFQWLKPDPESPDEMNWTRAKLPVSCGPFKPEKTGKVEDLLSFSHLVSWEAGKKRGQKSGTYVIVPRKGEIWALFKNWSIKWNASSSREYEYECVEILSDFDENVGARVSYLEKVKGFVCLFKQKEGGETVIPGRDKYIFSHLIPSCRMSGEEKGVPKGSYEVDPASLPFSIFERGKL